jgi:hypothetical protein
MTEHRYYNSAEHIGRLFGRWCRGLLRSQARCHRALVQAGLPPPAANVLIAVLWLLVAAVVFHYALWLAIVPVFLIGLLVAGVANLPNSVEREPEWRDGYSGHGLYDADGFRVDPYDPDKLN